VDKRTIETITIEYQEFKDDRHCASFNAARARTVEIARLLARSDPGSYLNRSAR
jgi:FMN-dependent NADH-azoreductase